MSLVMFFSLMNIRNHLCRFFTNSMKIISNGEENFFEELDPVAGNVISYSTR
jgi:hypothetical protein